MSVHILLLALQGVEAVCWQPSDDVTKSVTSPSHTGSNSPKQALSTACDWTERLLSDGAGKREHRRVEVVLRCQTNRRMPLYVWAVHQQPAVKNIALLYKCTLLSALKLFG